MGRRIAILIGVVALVAIGVVLVDRREAASSVPHTVAPGPTSQPAQAIDVPSNAVVPPMKPEDASIVPSVPTPTTSATDPPVAPPASMPPPTPPLPPSTTGPERPVIGESPYPVGGKPVGPFDIAWAFQVGVTQARGSITIRHLSPAARVVVEVAARDGARLAQPLRSEVELGQGVAQTFPLEVVLGQGTNTLVVTATALGADRRARVVSIPLGPPATEPVPPVPPPNGAVPGGAVPGGATPEKPVAPLSGSQVIRDDKGEVIQFEPAAPAGR